MPIRIVVADDHSVVRQGLRMFLGPDPELEVIGEAANGLEALLVVAEPRTDTLRIQASRGFDKASLEIGREALRSLTTAALDRRTETLVVEDAATDERSIRTVIDAARIGSYLDIPVYVDGKVFGMFNVSFTGPRKFARSDSRLFEALSNRAGVAIENARLYERSQQAASLEERQRLARELHDSVSQALYGIALGARTARTLLERDPKAAAEPLDYVLSLAEAGLAELRALIFELRPESLETEGVVAAFEKQVAAIRARHGIEVVAALGMEPDVPFEVKEVVYRIGQEALHNTVKHARATRMELTLRLDRGKSSLTLVVADNGQGFDPAGDFPGHLGLKSMAERARNIAGTFSITSAEGRGTTVELVVPLKASVVAPEG